MDEIEETERVTFGYYSDGFSVSANAIGEEALTWTEVVQKFHRFMKAAGWDYITGFTVHTEVHPEGRYINQESIIDG